MGTWAAPFLVHPGVCSAVWTQNSEYRWRMTLKKTTSPHRAFLFWNFPCLLLRWPSTRALTEAVNLNLAFKTFWFNTARLLIHVSKQVDCWASFVPVDTAYVCTPCCYSQTICLISWEAASCSNSAFGFWVSLFALSPYGLKACEMQPSVECHPRAPIFHWVIHLYETKKGSQMNVGFVTCWMVFGSLPSVFHVTACVINAMTF